MNFQEILDTINATPPNQAAIIEDGFDDAPDDGSVMRRASSGKPRIQRMYDHTEYEITVQVAGIHKNSLDDMYAAYDTNKNSVNELTHPVTSVTYSVSWLSPGRVVEIDGEFLTMEFKFTGTRP